MPSLSGFVPLPSGEEDSPRRRISAVNPRLSRTNYFDGRLLRASDLTRDQFYLDERLNEVGRAFGQGVISGLEVSLSPTGSVSVAPGLAVAPSGRVLELAQSLTVNLFDSARIATLNPKVVAPLGSGLFVLAISLAVKGAGAAEVFPADLSDDREFQFNVVEEGVTLSLVKLSVRLGVLNRRGGSRFSERAGLARTLLGNPGQPPELDDGAVALALISMDEGRPVWIDEWLVRRNHRAPGALNQTQIDLATFYNSLMDEVIADRNARAQTGGFRASSLFDVLPPAGIMPADGVDAQNGRQSFFPAHFDVAIAPVRTDDLPALLEEALPLTPIDLGASDAQDIVVLAPLADAFFSRFARQLEYDPLALEGRELAYRAAVSSLDGEAPDIPAIREALEDYERYVDVRADDMPHRLPSLDPLSLRARGLGTADVLDTDALVWRNIMEALDGPLWFTRRPPRAAETAVSAVVLARGYTVPEPGEDPGADTEALEDALDAANEEVERLRAELAAREAEIEALNETIAEGNDAAVADLQAQIARLRAELETASAQAALVPGLRSRVDELEGDLQRALAEVQRLNDALAGGGDSDALNAEIAALREQVSSLQAEIARLREQLEMVDTPLGEVVRSRRIADEAAARAAADLADAADGSPPARRRVLASVILTPAQFDAALWPTLNEAFEARTLPGVVDLLRSLSGASNFGAQMADALPGLGVRTVTANLWTNSTPAPPTDDRALRSPRELADARGIDDGEVRESVDRLADLAGDDRTTLTLVGRTADAVPRRYDPILWETLAVAVEAGTLTELSVIVTQAAERDRPIGQDVARRGADLGLSDEQIERWRALDNG